MVLVAPATATLLAKYAAGIADDLLTATLLATPAPVVVCPAMHTEMWEHPATVDNVATLRRRGVPWSSRRRAAGRRRRGRRPPGRVEEILSAVGAPAGAPADLAGRTVLVTAGGTREASTRSGSSGTGRRASRVRRSRSRPRPGGDGDAGHAPPTGRRRPDRRGAGGHGGRDGGRGPGPGRRRRPVVMAAAVADFRPKAPADGKLHKADGVPEIVLEPTTDILAELGRRKRPGQVLVGFAAETGDLRAGRRAKLRAKRLDLIVANDVTAPGAGFGHDTNAAMSRRRRAPGPRSRSPPSANWPRS